MDTVATAALSSWPLNPAVILLLLTTAAVYMRGWRRVRRLLPKQFTVERLLAFLLGLLLVWISTESPLDAFSALLLQAHMTQHLLLMMVAPPLILLGQPMLPLLHGLPRAFVKQALGPFLTWTALRRVATWLVSPVVAWIAFAVSTVSWHLPALYELGLRSPGWHNVEHACFFWTAILFWWPVIQPWPSRPHWPRWAMIPYLLSADIVNTVVAASLIFADKILYPTYAATQFAGFSPREDQSIAGSIMWVPGSVVYLVPAVLIVVRLVSPAQGAPQFSPRKFPSIARQGSPLHSGFDLLKLPIAGAFLRWRHARRVAQTFMLVLAAAIVLDGLRGHQMAPMNMAGVLPWVHWRGFLVLALLIAGNWFCFACPFMLPREIGKRLFRGNRHWPPALRSKWLAVGLLVVYFWAYEAFSLWNSPWLTAWIIVAYFTSAFFIDGFFRGATFCKYVCPIGQFNFIGSLVSPFEVKIKKESICQSCQSYDCIRGNQQQRGCELFLFQPKKASSLDCTFCLDCVHACPHDNVGIVPVLPTASLSEDPYRSSLGRLSKRRDVAAVAWVFVFTAFANAAGMITPILNWESAVASGVPHPVLIAGLLLLAVVIIPACAIGLCAWLMGRLDRLPAAMAPLTTRFIFTLVPIGLGMWAAHLAYHLVTGGLAIVPLIQQAIAGVANAAHVRPDWALAAQAALPSWLPPLQLILLDGGLLATLYACWQIARHVNIRAVRALPVFAPWGLLACALYATGVWIVLQPMQMRGMMMH